MKNKLYIRAEITSMCRYYYIKFYRNSDFRNLHVFIVCFAVFYFKNLNENPELLNTQNNG